MRWLAACAVGKVHREIRPAFGRRVFEGPADDLVMLLTLQSGFDALQKRAPEHGIVQLSVIAAYTSALAVLGRRS